ncbi:MAG: hypothetical protein ACRD3Y_04685, partial [Bryobacteraceae bacterium]
MTFQVKERGPAAKNVRRSSPNLRISQPNDALEQQADRIAEEVMAGGAAKLQWSFPRMGFSASLQRKCACGGEVEGECEDCKKQKL